MFHEENTRKNNDRKLRVLIVMVVRVLSVLEHMAVASCFISCKALWLRLLDVI